MGSYSQISCKEIGKVLYNSTFKGRENGPEAEGGRVVKEIVKERNFQAEKKPNFVFMSYGHYWSFLV